MDACREIEVGVLAHRIAERSETPRELAMSAAWHGGLARSLTTVDGESLAVVFHGHWTHGFGPDFSDAMIEFPGNDLRTGAVEIHTRSSDWTAHGHEHDPRYDTVILHVVRVIDSLETRTANGRIVPTVVLDVADEALFAIDARLPGIWSELGGTVCAPHLGGDAAGRLRAILTRLGDERLDARSRAMESDFLVRSPDVILLAGLLDVCGYSENREGMRTLALRLLTDGSLAAFGSLAMDERLPAMTAWMLGLAGFFPLSPVDAAMTGVTEPQRIDLEHRWVARQADRHTEPLSALAWTRARTRPANHPAARLVSAAALLARLGSNPVGSVVDLVTADPEPLATLQRWSTSEYGPALGRPRAIAMLANVVIPFSLALARYRGDDDLEDAASRLWANLPMGEWSRPARRALAQAAGLSSLARVGERGMQGLLHLDRTRCTPRRCYECPVAADVLRASSGNGAVGLPVRGADEDRIA